MKELKANKIYEGWQKQYSHYSESLKSDMNFSIYLPEKANEKSKVPVLYWLSGLTCTDENFMQKAGAQRVAAKLGLAIVCCDTSPRGPNVPDDEGYDLGQGAGFYVNATMSPWHKHFQMYDYVLNELPQLIQNHFPVNHKRSISGHSMGGHGALVLALRNPQMFQSVSAFSPICNPAGCAWGRKAFKAYLGEDETLWASYDASQLMMKDTFIPMMVDQGTADEFLDEQLKPETLESVAQSKGYPLTLRKQVDYDHSYYFIATFIEDHLRFHFNHLG